MLFLLLGLLPSEVIACPSRCNCTEVTVDCSSRGLVAFPSELPSSTITLNLRGNRIGRLSIDDVKGLPHLETLIISENIIRTIDENILDFLPLLRRVSFARNNLRVIPSLAAQPSRLVSLDLRHNEISTIDVQAFSYLPQLIQLDLAHNKLQSLPQMVFTKNTRIATLKLHRNPWHCDCRIVGLSKLAVGKSKPNEDAKCFNPPKLREVSLQKVAGKDVSCSKPSVSVDEFQKVLNCPALGGGEVHWLYNNVDLDFSSADSYQLKDNGSLVIPKEASAHGYQCTADYGVIPQ
ncbi:leucine Rich repeat-containing domain protein, partial [Oesophagostomum dentatum]